MNHLVAYILYINCMSIKNKSGNFLFLGRFFLMISPWMWFPLLSFSSLPLLSSWNTCTYSLKHTSRQLFIILSQNFALLSMYKLDFPGGSEVKASACNTGDLGSIPGSGRPPGEGNGNPLHYYCLENPMDGGAWWATVYGVAKSWTRLSDFTYSHYV